MRATLRREKSQNVAKQKIEIFWLCETVELRHLSRTAVACVSKWEQLDEEKDFNVTFEKEKSYIFLSGTCRMMKSLRETRLEENFLWTRRRKRKKKKCFNFTESINITEFLMFESSLDFLGWKTDFLMVELFGERRKGNKIEEKKIKCRGKTEKEKWNCEMNCIN